MPSKNALKWCKNLNGKVEGNVCMVGDYPVPLEDYSYCEPVVQDAVINDEAIVLLVSPKDAKKLFPPIARDIPEGIDELEVYNKKSLNNIRQRIRNKEGVCPPILNVCFYEDTKKSGGIEFAGIGHEGRHRIMGAILEGTKLMPIVIRRKPNEYCGEYINQR